MSGTSRNTSRYPNIQDAFRALTITTADVEALGAAMRDDALETYKVTNRTFESAFREHPFDVVDIMLLFKDESGNNFVHAAASVCSQSKLQSNSNTSKLKYSADITYFKHIIMFVCAHPVFNLKPGMLLSILSARTATLRPPFTLPPR